MPQLSDSMVDGTILSWVRAEGDQVAAGDELVEIETDKAAMTYEAEADGYLRIVGEEGESYPVGTVIAYLTPEREAVAEQGNGDRPEAAPPLVATAAAPPAAVRTGLRASPLARRLAADAGVSLESIDPTGPGGRIVLADVKRAAGVTDAPAAPAAPAPAPAPAPGEATVIEPTRIQQVIARRMSESKATAPEFSMTIDVGVDELLALRQQARRDERPIGSINDFVVKAAALALVDHPKLNGAYREQRFELYEHVNVGVAVAAPDALLVPTVFDADKRSIGEIARVTRDLAARARAGELTPPELGGGTFTVSNLGMYGIRDFVPILNPPQAAILAVGAIRTEPVVREGELGERSLMSLTLVGDHRILNGADGAEFLATLRAGLEDPLVLALR